MPRTKVSCFICHLAFRPRNILEHIILTHPGTECRFLFRPEQDGLRLLLSNSNVAGAFEMFFRMPRILTLDLSDEETMQTINSINHAPDCCADMPIEQFGGFTDADLRGCPLCSNRFYSWQPRSILSKVNPERLVHRTWRDLQLVSPCFAAFNDSTTILTPPALEFLKASKELVQLKIRHECLEYTYNTIGKP